MNLTSFSSSPLSLNNPDKFNPRDSEMISNALQLQFPPPPSPPPAPVSVITGSETKPVLNHGCSTISPMLIRVIGFGSNIFDTKLLAATGNEFGYLNLAPAIFLYISTKFES
ncbi:hypothetical protein HanRHA438_Chr11g0513811 [Helianthus annuus]|nr:hypothetical protein HanIR_Chr11g0539531 [Helianthus annuus]KAJ0871551.1 hypothetical protein HanRHA438_Chr11g0513811 [Helianthus annuus]